jgi:hypothetical protein
MNAPNHPVSAREMLRQAFQQYQENPDAVVSVADQILCAAMQVPKLNFTPTALGRLAIAIGDDEPLEVGLPHDSVSSFRTLLARFGVICGTTAEKHSLAGKFKASLKRAGLVADKNVTERKKQMVDYVSAAIREQPGSPLYKVDADLNVKQPNGMAAALHLIMQNELQKLSLLIESRKASGAP